MNTVVILGRPNVGKSTIYNRLTGSYSGIVSAVAGLTRDWNESHLIFGKNTVSLIDTAGLDKSNDNFFSRSLLEDTFTLLDNKKKEILFILYVFDGVDGVTNFDLDFISSLRKVNIPIVLAVNKIDCKNACRDKDDVDFVKLGCKDILFVSAEHNMGITDLKDYIGERLKENLVSSKPVIDPDKGKVTVNIAIIGSPNVGKSTYINKLLKQNRCLTDPKEHTTRDVIAIPWSYKGKKINLIDTAGIRKVPLGGKHEVKRKVVNVTWHAIKNKADVIVFIVDSQTFFTKNDLYLLGKILDIGVTLVLAINKCDLAEDRSHLSKFTDEYIANNICQILKLPIVTISALYEEDLFAPINKALTLSVKSKKKFTTSELNNFLIELSEINKLQSIRNNVKFKYMTQVSCQPQHFVVFINVDPKRVDNSIKRYFSKKLGAYLGLELIPFQVTFKN